MSQRLSDTIVKELPAPASGNKIYYDSEVKGFGVRVTAKGARSFILNYRTRKGRERRYTIGQFPDWRSVVARQEAAGLKRKVDIGLDPMEEVEADRNAKTVADLCDRFIEEYLPRLRPATQRDYGSQIKLRVLPAMKHLAVSDVTYSDVDDLHRKITKEGSPYAANRTVALMSKMFTQAIKWGWRSDNPANGIERNQEIKRERYLSTAELSRLTAALSAYEDQEAANIIRLLLLTGARRGEVLSARWDQLDLTNGVWTKQASTTKQKKLHRVPLSAPARQLLVDIQKSAKKDAEYVFPGRGSDHRIDIKKNWRALCISADIVDVTMDANGKRIITPTARMHDLRHTYASVLVSSGMSLPIIGALLGHSEPATTARYAHLMDDPLRQATERAGALVLPSGETAEVIDLKAKSS